MLDLLTPTSRTGESSSLLGTASGALALRVCGGAHRGRVIQIQSPKCTIGSAAGCTLRLRAIGVRPLHCWILRGAEGTVVRRRCGGTLVNGQAYEDAPLRVGDLLRIGTVELEVVDCQPPNPPPPVVTVTQRMPDEPRLENREKVRELEACLTAANEEIARLEGDAQQAWQTSITAAERAEQMRVALERANVEFGEERAELESALAALQNEQQDLQAELQSHQRQEAEARRELAANIETLVRSERELAEQTKRLASEREAFEQQTRRLQSELEQARAQACQQGSQMTITMDQVRAATQAAQSVDWETRYATLDEELQETRHELAAARQERDAGEQWRAKFLEAERQVERWQAEADIRRTQIEELQAQLAALRTEFSELQVQRSAAEFVATQELAEQQRALEQQRAELAAREEQLGAARQVLAERESELQAQREALDSERSAQQGKVNEQAEQQLAEQRQELERQREELAAREERVHEAHRGLVEFEEELKRGRDALDSERAAQQTALDEQATHLQRQEELLRGQAEDLAAKQAKVEEAREWLARAEADLESRQETFIVQEAELEAGRSALALAQAEFDQQREAAGEFTDEPPQRTMVGDFSAIAAQCREEASSNEVAAESPDMEVVDSVLNRLVQSGLWRGDRDGDLQEAAPSEPAVEPRQESAGATPPDENVAPADVASPNNPAPAGSAVPSDEESIETYMERLMQRVRGDAPSASRQPLVAAFQPAPKQPEPAPQAPVQEAADPQIVTPEAYLPRREAPEQSQNLAAMRELANSAARSAIEKHHQKSHGKQAAGRLLGAGIVLLGSALLGYWAWHSHSLTAGVGAAIGLLAGTLWALRGFGWLLNSLKLSHPTAPPENGKAVDETPMVAEIDDAVPMDAAPLDPATLEAAATVESPDSDQPAASEEIQPPA